MFSSEHFTESEQVSKLWMMYNGSMYTPATQVAEGAIDACHMHTWCTFKCISLTHEAEGEMLKRVYTHFILS